MSELPKTFDPAAIEARWYPHWEERGLFAPARPGAEPFTIVMPPPNVTGALHIGHALDDTLQDILVRHARLKGRDARWVVGTDHAGIATQMVVERNLAAEGLTRQALGREAFVEKIWAWKAESGGAITRQLRRLGASCDWANERFTMDEGFSQAVTHVFVELHKRGLLYRDKRLVNWDPKFRTAISDLEVEYREVAGKFWHFRYPLADGSGFIPIATTRPETILGDGAVAVHPDDARYAHLIGGMCRLPVVERLIPIIADEHVRADFGSGAVKITAAHDFNDFAVAQRHPEAAIPLIGLMTEDARMNENCPEAYRGLTREAARAKVVADFAALGLLDKIEDHVHQVPYGDRSGVVIEPRLTEQWYVDAEKLAGPALAAVREKRIKVVPATWEKTYAHWLENIQPWCVSRQLWWGHRIPAWYGPDGIAYVAEDEAAAQVLAGAGVPLTRDPDVLDTWFSSALWPFATLGWPDADPKAAGRYPNDILISGFDILFFWDARMIMQGLEFMGDVPFRTLYLHGLVRDAAGQKMSKSKGNTVDPLVLIDRYGADALRFTLAAMESQGRDIKLDEKRVEGYRNFSTKLWNAARFCQANRIVAAPTLEAPDAELPVNRWIIGETVRTVQALDLALADLRFDEAANTIYHFVWDRYCDWYLELIKPVSSEAGRGGIGDETRAVAGWALDQILVMLHPFMPFVTEELWHALAAPARPREHALIVARWPMADARGLDAEASADVEWLIGLIQEIRAARTELNVPPGPRVPLAIGAPSAGARRALRGGRAALERLARVEVRDGERAGGMNVPVLAGADTFYLSLEGVIDIDAERGRLGKGLIALEKELAGLTGRLSSDAFIAKARPEAIAKARADHAERAGEAERLRTALARLG